MKLTRIFIGGILAVALFAIFQASFLAHIPLWGMVPNILVVFILGIALRENVSSSNSIVCALFGGLLLDIFSERPLGIAALILLIAVLFIKIIRQRYVRLSFF
ncbi:MAG: rod shape-determining protein MreD [Candidatus Wildermuthbacteria bacterium]|nr:rod shape-determining protein MreD [Candidatus Wildermuthbacteria bacterium]